MKATQILMLLLLLASTYTPGKAQDATPLPNVLQHFDASFGFFVFDSHPVAVSALSFMRTHGVLKSRKLRLGYGLRFSNYFAKGLSYTTAPYRLTKDMLIDTLVVDRSMSFALNANLHLAYIIIPK